MCGARERPSLQVTRAPRAGALGVKTALETPTSFPTSVPSSIYLYLALQGMPLPPHA